MPLEMSLLTYCSLQGQMVDRTSMRRTVIIALAILLGYGIRTFALNPTLDVTQYAHTAWKVSDGFFAGIIFSIAQTPDGYVWVGTDSGLFGFDGVRSVPWHPPVGSQLPGSDIRSCVPRETVVSGLGPLEALPV
jgi:hypothetical protein